jgi:hypothetical protein
MKEDKYFEEKISRALEAIKHPETLPMKSYGNC